tara:strand:- start:100 stop:507 length:408 start_codon:yes stop_codon:yes gene_type:complete
MGEMADFYNEYQERTLEVLESYGSGEMSMEEAFEHDLINALGVEQFNSELLDYCTTPWNLQSQLEKAIAALVLAEKHGCNDKLDSSALVTADWLKKLADFYRNHLYLSDKQAAIVERNYPAGLEQFKRDALKLPK